MTDERSPEDLWRTALHESAHGVTTLLLGGDLDMISIRPGEHFAGIAFPNLPTWRGDSRREASIPGPFVDPQLRRVIEMEIVVSLAGQIGAHFAPPPPGARYTPDADCRTAAESLARDLADLSPRHAELLAQAETDPEPPLTDRQKAEKASAGMSDRDTEMHLHVAYMEGVTRKLVDWHSREIVAVASELYRRHVLTGDEVRAAMRSAYPPIRRSAA